MTAETIEQPERSLQGLKDTNAHLQRDVWLNDIKRFAARFEQQHGYTLEFKPLAEDALIQLALEQDRTIQSLCEEKFKDFEHGLTIIHRNTGQTVFKIGKLAVVDPDKELSQWVVRSIERVKNDA